MAKRSRKVVEDNRVIRKGQTGRVINPKWEEERRIIPLAAKNENQKKALKSFTQKDLVILSGSAGAGKTEIMCWWASKQFLEGRVNNIIITRPYQHLGKDYGAVPGPQPLYAKVATPDGWKTMGDIEVGDFVIGQDGNPVEVLGTFPKGKKDVYRVTTSDGRVTYACDDHLWYVQSNEERKRGKEGKVRTTKEIRDDLSIILKGKVVGNYILPKVEPINYKLGVEDMPLHPYTLGALLGDGTISSKESSVVLYSNDEEILDKVEEVSPELSSKNFQDRGISLKSSDMETRKVARKLVMTNNITGEVERFERIGKVINDPRFSSIPRGTISSYIHKGISLGDYSFKFEDKSVNFSDELKNTLDRLGVLGLKSYDKFIPDMYKYSSVESRMWLLRGLMDTDGTVNKLGGAVFCTTSKRLAEDVQEIVRSLGGMCTVVSRDRVGKSSGVSEDRKIVTRRVSYEFDFNLPEGLVPFYLPRKANKYSHTKNPNLIRIVSIDKVGEDEVKCILVDNQNHLYVTDDFIVTHNTDTEKLMPFCMSMLMKFKKYLGVGVLRNNFRMDIGEQLFEEVSGIVIVPVEKIQGLSFDNKTIILCDEGQNTTPAQMKSLTTRMEEGCQLIVAGDKTQTALRTQNGLHLLEEILLDDPHESAEIIRFTADDNCRSGISGHLTNIFEERGGVW